MQRLGEILSKSVSGVSSDQSPEGKVREAEPEEPDPTVCIDCGGAGFVRRELPFDDPNFGKAEPCVCALSEADTDRQARLSRLSELEGLSRFDFDWIRSEESPRSFPPAAVEVARRFSLEPAGWLVISGPSGSGKTILAAAVANERVKSGEPALFMVVPDLLDHLRAGYSPGSGDLSYEEVLEQVRKSPFLVLDDVDAASPTEWAREKLFQVVNHRQNANLSTTFTCADLGNLDERLATRLSSDRTTHLELATAKGGPRYDQVGGMSSERIALMTLSNFDLRGGRRHSDEQESLLAAYRAANDFAERPHGFLTLLGVNGCGKTHLAGAIVNKVLAAGGSVFFAVVPDLLDHLRASFAPGRESAYDDTFERVRSVDLLVLDDLGAQASSPWAQEKLFQIVNYRTVAGMATVVTSDRDRDQLATAHPRIAARVFDPRIGVTIGILATHYSLGPRPERRGSPRSR